MGPTEALPPGSRCPTQEQGPFGTLTARPGGAPLAVLWPLTWVAGQAGKAVSIMASTRPRHPLPWRCHAGLCSDSKAEKPRFTIPRQLRTSAKR